jgi:hypothetical protein
MDSDRDSLLMGCDNPQLLLGSIIPELIVNQQSFSYVHLNPHFSWYPILKMSISV